MIFRLYRVFDPAARRAACLRGKRVLRRRRSHRRSRDQAGLCGARRRDVRTPRACCGGSTNRASRPPISTAPCIRPSPGRCGSPARRRLTPRRRRPSPPNSATSGAQQKLEIGASLLHEALSPSADTFAGLIEGEDGKPGRGDAARPRARRRRDGASPEAVDAGRAGVAAEMRGRRADQGPAGGRPVLRRHRRGASYSDRRAGIDRRAGAGDFLAQARTRGDGAEGDRARRRATPTAAMRRCCRSTSRSARPRRWRCSTPPPASATPSARHSDELTRRLLADRNETMAERAAPLLAKGGAFIAVGALHLSGKRGLDRAVSRQGRL